jgi:hypothetical protein
MTKFTRDVRLKQTGYRFLFGRITMRSILPPALPPLQADERLKRRSLYLHSVRGLRDGHQRAHEHQMGLLASRRNASGG